jgi:hypothetical protein
LTGEAGMKDLLDIIEFLLEVINNLSSKSPSEEEKKELDELADKLDMAQNRLVKLIIKENDAEYRKITGELGAVISGIKKDLIELENLKNILSGVKQAVELITQVVMLLGV